MAWATRRTKWMTRNRLIPGDAWAQDRVWAWRTAHDLVAHAVPFYSPRPGCVVLAFPGMSDLHWGCFPREVLISSSAIALKNMSDEKLAFLGDRFKGS